MTFIYKVFAIKPFIYRSISLICTLSLLFLNNSQYKIMHFKVQKLFLFL